VSREVVIIDAVRTPIGRFRGALSGVRADQMAAALIQALLRRTGTPPEAVDDVILGCVTQIGEQSANIARTALLSAGLPYAVPGMTLDRKCGSGEAAIQTAAAQIAAGHAEVVIAGGAESMSRVPMGSNRALHGEAYGPSLLDRYEMTGQGEAGERLCDRWGLSRETLDAFAFRSHQRAAAAADDRLFDAETEPVDLAAWSDDAGANGAVTADETIRRQTTPEKLATLEPAFRPDGRLTAGNASQIADGAAAVLLMSRETAERQNLSPRAAIRAVATVGSDPSLMLTGPIAASRKVLDRSGLALSDIDLFEVNEAFASVPLVWLQETGASPDRLNVNGGAIALGHPLGATGARIMTSMLGELERRGARYGLQAICCNGGLGTATLIERLKPL